MKKFNIKITLSQYFGVFFLAFAAFFVARKIASVYSLTYAYYIAVYIALYFLGYSFASRIYSAVLHFACGKNYVIASIINILLFWFDIYYSFKMQKILNIFISNKNYDSLEVYFGDNHHVLSYTSLALCMFCYSTEPVNKWFYQEYISKNLPIDSDYFPIYKHLTNPDLKTDI